jgi:hypothetical protein
MKNRQKNVHRERTGSDLLSNVDAMSRVVRLSLAEHETVIYSITMLANALGSGKKPGSELFGLLYVGHALCARKKNGVSHSVSEFAKVCRLSFDPRAICT